MDRLKYVKLENEDGSYTSSIPLAVDSDHVDVNGVNLTNTLADKVDNITLEQNINRLENEMQSIASGSPAGAYATVAALTSANPDHSKIYVVTDDNHWYYYNNGWTDGGLYQASSNQEQVDNLESNFNKYYNGRYAYNINLAAITGKWASYADGIIKDLSSYSCSDYIQIKKGSKIFTPNNLIMTFYDTNKTFTKANTSNGNTFNSLTQDGSFNGKIGKITTAPNDGYVIIDIANSQIPLSNNKALLLDDVLDNYNGKSVEIVNNNYLNENTYIPNYKTEEIQDLNDSTDIQVDYEQDGFVKIEGISGEKITIIAKGVNDFEDDYINNSNVTTIKTNDKYSISYTVDSNPWYQIYADFIVDLKAATQYSLNFNYSKNNNDAISRCYVYNQSIGQIGTKLVLEEDNNITFTTGYNGRTHIRFYPAGNKDSLSEGTEVNILLSNLFIYEDPSNNYNYSKPYYKEMNIYNDGCYKIKISDGLKLDITGSASTMKLCKEREEQVPKKVSICCFGDSITGAFTDEDRNYPLILGKMLDTTVYNVGFGGCRMATHPTPKYDNFCMYKLVDAIYSNDFSAQESDTSGAPTFPTRLNTLESIDFNNLDIVTIAYGTNDWGDGYGARPPIDNSEDLLDCTTFNGAIRYSVSKLLAKNPKLKIILITPYYRYNPTTLEDSDTILPATNPNYHMIDYVNAVKNVGKELKIPVIDMYNELGVNKYNRTNYFTGNDGVHFNPNGMELIANKIAGVIKMLYLN